MSDKPEILLEQDKVGYWWLDNGHSDIGPFFSKDFAKAHRDRILCGREQHRYDEIDLYDE